MRLSGFVYDWDFWPGRVAAGLGAVSWYLWRMETEVLGFQRVLGERLLPVIRKTAKAMEALLAAAA